MRNLTSIVCQLFLFISFILSVSCAHISEEDQPVQETYDAPGNPPKLSAPRFDRNYSEVMPEHEDTNGKKLVLVDPNVHAWGAYDKSGNLIRAGIATSGGAECPPDANEADCRTTAGTYHIYAMKGEDCYSKTYPRPHGGGLMPYCMYFNNGQALHGSPDDIVVDNNISHGCVRMRISDAEWMWSNFATVGTTVKVVPYDS